MFKYFSSQKNSQKRGFTLIETMVSLSIFSVVMVASVGIILSIISSNKRNQAVNSVVNNLNYSIESMIRDIKTGFSYKCNYSPSTGQTVDQFKQEPHGCSSNTPINNIALVSTINGTTEMIVKYEYKLPVGDQVGYIEKTIYTNSGGVITSAVYPLTDRTNIDIKAMSFTVTPGTPLYTVAGTTNPSPAQPSVAVLIKGTAKVNAINISDFFIQTLISQRLPNLI